MTKKLTRHGNSFALIIDKPILRMLNITEKTNLELIVKGDELVVRPKSKKNRSKRELKRIQEDLLQEYADAFTKLAK